MEPANLLTMLMPRVVFFCAFENEALSRFFRVAVDRLSVKPLMSDD